MCKGDRDIAQRQDRRENDGCDDSRIAGSL